MNFSIFNNRSLEDKEGTAPPSIIEKVELIVPPVAINPTLNSIDLKRI